MHLNTLNVMLYDELSPSQVGSGIVVKNGENRVQTLQSFLSLFRPEAETIFICRSSANVPEFSEIFAEARKRIRLRLRAFQSPCLKLL